MRPRAIYISGPISGYEDLNRPAFTAAEMHLRSRYPDAQILNPFNNGLPPESEWQEHMRADIIILMGATEVCMLKGWQNSRGARTEYELAHRLGMPVYVIAESP